MSERAQERPQERPTEVLMRLTNGYQVTQAIHVASVLGIADRIAECTGGVSELAERTGTHAPSLYRLLRALASVGVLHEDEGARFSLTPVGECLRSDAPEPVGGWAALVGEDTHWRAWGALLHSVRTGENAFRHVHGMSPWEFRAPRPEANAVFNRAMTDLSRRANAALLDAYDFGRFGTVVDVAGGHGALLIAMLRRHPQMRGVLFDQPHVVSGAEERLRAAGVADRCRLEGGSFFDGVPEGGDAYMLKAIIHDWEDPECVLILRNCRRAVPDDGALLIIERQIGPANGDPEPKFSDLNMLVAPGGRERTIEEFEALLDASGFRLSGVSPNAAGLHVIEGTPV